MPVRPRGRVIMATDAFAEEDVAVEAGLAGGGDSESGGGAVVKFQAVQGFRGGGLAGFGVQDGLEFIQDGSRAGWRARA